MMIDEVNHAPQRISSDEFSGNRGFSRIRKGIETRRCYGAEQIRWGRHR